MVVLDTSAAANLVCFRGLDRHIRILEREAYQRAPTYPPGDGRPGVVRRAEDIPVGVAGSKCKFTAFVLDADIPALLRRGAPETLGG